MQVKDLLEELKGVPERWEVSVELLHDERTRVLVTRCYDMQGFLELVTETTLEPSSVADESMKIALGCSKGLDYTACCDCTDPCEDKRLWKSLDNASKGDVNV